MKVCALTLFAAFPAFASESHEEGGHTEEGTKDGDHAEEGTKDGGHTEAAEHAEAHAEAHEAHEEGHHGPRFLFGIKGAAYGAFAGEEASLNPALGVFVAGVLIPGHLELELDAKRVFAHEHASYPLALIAKKTFHVSRLAEPFVGFGPLIAFVPSEHGLHIFPGAEVVGGSYLWTGKRFGISLEATYGFLLEEEEVAHEVGGVLGLVIGI